eukprot:TRINITY_DN2078_c0_g1_i1.p1 TRINITY_DN2078_c0_g1~~TRINITY_DN2078_c0_g1_i1.p1  ORF type:complete len:353 (-),score=52.60 TRINITY_DN2078_c0_g1_i1:38-1096(-)
MSCCWGKADSAMQQSDSINKFLKEERRKFEMEVKLLLLGAGESGKSTIAKQMRILYLNEFSTEERLAYKNIISSNILSNIQSLVQATNTFDVPLQEASIPSAERLMSEEFEDVVIVTMTPSLVSDIKALWLDPGIQQVFQRSSEFQLSDSAGYYFDKLDVVCQEGYVPNEEDILRSRAKTTGIIETEFVVEGVTFKMLDVGGQRSERKKWMHCFQDVTAVIFCVALSEYDLRLYEDERTNRMHESLKIFHEVCNSRWFTDTAMILFMNKRDVFERKIKRIGLEVCFSDYKGGLNYDNAVQFIQNKFLSQNENNKKAIYTHVTCATDTRNISVVFLAVKDIALRRALDFAGVI